MSEDVHYGGFELIITQSLIVTASSVKTSVSKYIPTNYIWAIYCVLHNATMSSHADARFGVLNIEKG